MIHPLLIDPITNMLTDPLTHYLLSLLLIHYCTLTHGLVLYLDTDPSYI